MENETLTVFTGLKYFRCCHSLKNNVQCLWSFMSSLLPYSLTLLPCHHTPQIQNSMQLSTNIKLCTLYSHGFFFHFFSSALDSSIKSPHMYHIISLTGCKLTTIKECFRRGWVLSLQSKHTSITVLNMYIKLFHICVYHQAVQAYLGNIAGVFPGHCNKANSPKKVSHVNSLFPSTYKSYVYTIRRSIVLQHFV